MALTPMDIYNKEFGKGFRGYDEEEVDMFLDQVVDEYEKLQKANAAATEKIESLTERLEHYKSLEGTLKETLMTAQNTAEEVVENARKKAALIIDSAQREARDIVERAGGQIEQAEKMDMELRRAAAVFKSRFVALLEAQLEFFRQETADINAQRNRAQTGTAPQAQEPAIAEQAPVEPVVPEQEPELAAAAGFASAAPRQEPETVLPLEEREEPLTPDTPPEEPAAAPQEPETAFTPVESTEEYAPAPPQADPAPADTEPVQAAEQDDTDYFGTPQTPAEPSDTAGEEMDDADALIREIQHYSALRNDEDTVSDEGFIIGRDD